MPPTQPPGAPLVAQPAVERLPPEFPPEDRWWDNPWPAIIVGILGLIVGGLLGYELGGKGETVTGAQRGRGPAITRTVTNTTTVVRPKVVVQTNTVTQTPPPASSANEERRSEAEAKLRKVERENEELRRQQGEG